MTSKQREKLPLNTRNRIYRYVKLTITYIQFPITTTIFSTWHMLFKIRLLSMTFWVIIKLINFVFQNNNHKTTSKLINRIIFTV